MFSDLINKRRSIRDYIDKPIPKDDLLKCIEAARLAPSACNAQPWKFIVVDDVMLRSRICEKAFSGVYSINKFASNAAALVIVVSEKEKFLSAIGGYFRGTNYCLIDIGVACEHLILQAQELDIGSCWIGWFDEKWVKEVLDIPKSNKIDVIVSLGYCTQDTVIKKNRKKIEEMSSFNTYGG